MADRPKRRKYRDNPYILSYCEEKKLYIVTFKDVAGKIMDCQYFLGQIKCGQVYIALV